MLTRSINEEVICDLVEKENWTVGVETKDMAGDGCRCSDLCLQQFTCEEEEGEASRRDQLGPCRLR